MEPKGVTVSLFNPVSCYRARFGHTWPSHKIHRFTAKAHFDILTIQLFDAQGFTEDTLESIDASF
jgi:hypothetical protein